MAKKSPPISKTKVVGALAAIASVAAGSYFYFTPGKNHPSSLPSYTVARIIDGDTFETTDHLRVRLASSDAPDLNQCGGPEAKKELERLIMGKPVYLRVIFIDTYQRLLSMVYTSDTFVNAELLRTGYTYYPRSTPGFNKELSAAVEEARQKKRGIHRSTCTQRVNTKDPSCTIKGNISSRGKIYYAPDCRIYDSVDVQLYQGDQWFCTEAAAEKAGFRKAVQCS